ncbi:septum site-determining protein MinC [Roseibium sp. HPY-6]|uniref:septum site-determining protein MinC n=1 Tax=Roseibium sp. HPY-6 TaxID=3229852 RepID=UPI00338FAEDB
MKFKGKSFIAIVLSPEPPFEEWLKEVDRIIARSPGFFVDRPIILDVRGSNIPIADLEQLLADLRERSIRVMGIDGVAGTRLKEGMPPSFGGGRLTSDVEVPEPASKSGESGDAKPDKNNSQVKTDDDHGQNANGHSFAKSLEELENQQAKEGNSSIVISEPVRSGQSILHPDGDVTVIGSVSSGAEIIAGGSIHIYGALRGRALAGVAGKDNARIFCTKLDAELVSINGLYKVADDFDGTLRNSPAQIRFENETLVFEELN